MNKQNNCICQKEGSTGDCWPCSMDKQITKVCSECGILSNILTCIKKYGVRPNKLCFDFSTFHEAKCDVCGEQKPVTEPRDFFHPNFDLLKNYV